MTKIKVFCARSMTVAVSRLAGDFMRESGHEVDITFGPVGTLPPKLAAGETADVLILGAPGHGDDGAEGRRSWPAPAPTSRASSSGLRCARAPPAPDISTAGRVPQGPARRARRSRSPTPRSAAPPRSTCRAVRAHGHRRRDQAQGHAAAERRRGRRKVASGEADIGITLIPEILPIKGASVIGKLPAALADDTTYTAAVSAGSRGRRPRRPSSPRSARPRRATVWQAAGLRAGGARDDMPRSSGSYRNCEDRSTRMRVALAGETSMR